MAENEKRSRRRGKGSLQPYKTKAGERWRYQIWIPIDPEQPGLGEKKFSRGGFETADAADDALQEAIRKRKNDEKFHGAVPTLNEYGEDWLDSLTLADSTLLGYRRQFNNYIVPHLGGRPLDKITGPAVGKLYKMLRERGGQDGAPLSANTVNKTSITLAAILDAAMEDGLIIKNPARLKRIVKAPTGRDIRAEKAEMVTWSPEQLRAFLVWNRDVYDDYLHALWLTLANTGMRRGEALALKWGDLDHKTQRISIRRAVNSAKRGETKLPKSSKPRVVDADATLLRELKRLRSANAELSLELVKPGAYIFAHDDGRLRDPKRITDIWTRRVEQAHKKLGDDAFPRIPLHGLRHTHATILMGLGESPKVVQERLGHSSISITLDIYSHVTETMQRGAVDRFSALFG